MITLCYSNFQNNCDTGYVASGNSSQESCVPELFYYNSSTLQAAYFFESVILDGLPLNENDWVGAFNGDICVGARKWDIDNCNGICDVPILGQDSPLTSGYMQHNDIPSFKIFKASSLSYLDASPSENIPWSNFSTPVMSFLYACDDSDCEPDCLGVFGGLALEDCEGVCGGLAVEDCEGVCGGDAVADENFDCDGNCLTEYDDYDICGGTNECLSSSPIPQNTFTMLSTGEVLYHSTNEIVDFQFEIDWCSDTNLCPGTPEQNSINSIYGGDAENWIIDFNNSSNSSEILGIFTDNQSNDHTLSPGCGVLMVLDISNFTGNVHGISDGLWSGPGAVPLNLTFDECTICTDQLSASIVDDFVVVDAYPNPFNPDINIEFSLPNNNNVSILIYNVYGKVIKKVLDNKYLYENTYKFNWDGKDNVGNKVPSGVYFINLSINKGFSTRKVTLIK